MLLVFMINISHASRNTRVSFLHVWSKPRFLFLGEACFTQGASGVTFLHKSSRLRLYAWPVPNQSPHSFCARAALIVRGQTDEGGAWPGLGRPPPPRELIQPQPVFHPLTKIQDSPHKRTTRKLIQKFLAQEKKRDRQSKDRPDFGGSVAIEQCHTSWSATQTKHRAGSVSLPQISRNLLWLMLCCEVFLV